MPPSPPGKEWQTMFSKTIARRLGYAITVHKIAENDLEQALH